MSGPGDRVLVAGIGYRNLRDHSVGVMVTDRLAQEQWADGVVVEDLSYGPIAVVQRLEDDPPGRRFHRAVFVAAVAREDGRPPGTIAVYRWDEILPSPALIQGAVGEAVTGVIALDNTIVVAGHFGALPPEVVIVEIEPAEHAPGETLGAVVAAAFEPLCELVRRLALEPGFAAELPVASLGGAPLVWEGR